jgi:uncharacterized membrane protein
LFAGSHEANPRMSQTHIQEHVDLIAKHEQEFLEQRTRTERLGDSIASFTGSLTFVLLHIAVFVLWIGVNTFTFAGVRHFDPPPFSLLGTCLGFEAILLASFILMRQTRIGRRADERDHLMLQILLLAEKEITTLLSMDRQIAGSMGLQKVAKDKEIEELSKHTSIEDVAQTIKDSLPAE